MLYAISFNSIKGGHLLGIFGYYDTISELINRLRVSFVILLSISFA